jgi:DNA-binding transcriptional regulator YiaG
MTLTPSEKVLILRRRMKLTQDEFGKLLGVSGKTVQFWELGRAPKAAMMEKVEILGKRYHGN